MSSKLDERVDVRLGLESDDIADPKTGPYVPLDLHRQALAVLVTGEVAATKIVTLEILQATSAAGADAEVLKEVEVEAPSGGAPLVLTANVRAEELDTGFGFVAIRAKTDDDAVDGVYASASWLLGDGRYS